VQDVALNTALVRRILRWHRSTLGRFRDDVTRGHSSERPLLVPTDVSPLAP
jgi:hypothetical protein